MYTQGTSAWLGTQIETTGWYCVYNGNWSTATITGLTTNTAYRVHAITYSNSGPVIRYNSNAGTNNPTNGSTGSVTAVLNDGYNISGRSFRTDSIVSTQTGGLSVTQKGICWGTSPNPTTALTTKTTKGSGTGTSVNIVEGLTLNTSYYVRAYATNSLGTFYSTQKVISTNLNEIGNGDFDDDNGWTLAGGATINSSGQLVLPSGATATQSTLSPNAWGTPNYVYNFTYTIISPAPTNGGKLNIKSGTNSLVSADIECNTSVGTHSQAFTTKSSGTLSEFILSAGTVNSSIIVDAGIVIWNAYGLQFGNTTTNPPTHDTVTASGSISTTTTAISSRGFVYAIGNSNPTIGGPSCTQVAQGSGYGSFSSTITGLTSNTTYWIRSYGINQYDTYYGVPISFSTQNTAISFTGGTADTGTTETSTTVTTVIADTPTTITERGFIINTTNTGTDLDWEA